MFSGKTGSQVLSMQQNTSCAHYVYNSALVDFRKLKRCSVRPTETLDMSLVNASWLIPNFHPQVRPHRQLGWPDKFTLQREKKFWKMQNPFQERKGHRNPDPSILSGCGLPRLWETFLPGRKVQGDAQQALLSLPRTNSGLLLRGWETLQKELLRAPD